MRKVRKHREAACAYGRSGRWDKWRSHDQRADELEFGVKRPPEEARPGSIGRVPIQPLIHKPERQPEKRNNRKAVPLKLRVARLNRKGYAAVDVAPQAEQELQARVMAVLSSTEMDDFPYAFYLERVDWRGGELSSWTGPELSVNNDPERPWARFIHTEFSLPADSGIEIDDKCFDILDQTVRQWAQECLEGDSKGLPVDFVVTTDPDWKV